MLLFWYSINDFIQLSLIHWDFLLNGFLVKSFMDFGLLPLCSVERTHWPAVLNILALNVRYWSAITNSEFALWCLRISSTSRCIQTVALTQVNKQIYTHIIYAHACIWVSIYVRAFMHIYVHVCVALHSYFRSFPGVMYCQKDRLNNEVISP